jgi:hypothetical protein
LKRTISIIHSDGNKSILLWTLDDETFVQS